jgi:membrane-bound ClpP family serine protease
VVQPGETGIALTKLRPAGKAQINGRRVDVITQGQMLDEGCPVEVIEVSGIRIVVRETRKS